MKGRDAQKWWRKKNRKEKELHIWQNELTLQRCCEELVLIFSEVNHLHISFKILHQLLLEEGIDGRFVAVFLSNFFWDGRQSRRIGRLCWEDYGCRSNLHPRAQVSDSLSHWWIWFFSLLRTSLLLLNLARKKRVRDLCLLDVNNFWFSLREQLRDFSAFIQQYYCNLK